MTSRSKAAVRSFMASRQVPERTQRGSVLCSRPRGGKERLRAVLLPELCRVPPRSSPFKCAPAARAAASLTCGAARLPPLRSPGGRGGRRGGTGRAGGGRGGRGPVGLLPGGRFGNGGRRGLTWLREAPPICREEGNSVKWMVRLTPRS